MSKGMLTFRVNLPLDYSAYIDMPIEVRRPNFTLVTRALCSETLELEPGIYFVKTTLPGGHELVERVEVRANEESAVHLAPDATTEAEADSAYTWQGLAKGVERDEADIDFDLDPTGTLADEGVLRVGEGNLLTGGTSFSSPDGWVRSNEEAGRIQWRVPGKNASHLVQLLQPGQPALNVVLPTWDQQGCYLNLTRLPNSSYLLTAQLYNVEADMLLRYRERGYLKQANAMASSSDMTAERLLAGKVSDPFAATVGAYTLLRMGELERLHDWTENLKNWFTWLPDGLTLRAEHHARLGEHHQALPLLLELPERGLPYFSEGLGYAVDRLRLYIGAGTSHFDPASIDAAQRLLGQLHTFSRHTDFTRPILTVTGLNPEHPDTTPLTPDMVYDADGLYIPDLLH